MRNNNGGPQSSSTALSTHFIERWGAWGTGSSGNSDAPNSTTFQRLGHAPSGGACFLDDAHEAFWFIADAATGTFPTTGTFSYGGSLGSGNVLGLQGSYQRSLGGTGTPEYWSIDANHIDTYFGFDIDFSTGSVWGDLTILNVNNDANNPALTRWDVQLTGIQDGPFLVLGPDPQSGALTKLDNVLSVPVNINTGGITGDLKGYFTGAGNH